METADLISVYPRLYHMAKAGSWEDTNKSGLLSTSALLHYAGIGVQTATLSNRNVAQFQ
ncbi:MAG: hypothetical protein AAF671_00770 [Pseudomonadota bacterium]